MLRAGGRAGRRAYRVVEAKVAHVLDIRDRLREKDRRECEGQGQTVQRALYRTFRRSLWARSVLFKGRVIAMWGLCGSFVSDEGQPWLVTTPEVEQLPVAVLREARKGVAEMLDMKPFLWNYVAADYAQAVKMLKMLGFTLDESVTLPTGAAFRRFWMRRE